MKMSEKKRLEVYSAISDSIMELRIKIKLNKENSAIKQLSIDSDLFNLELKIWSKVKRALHLEGV